MFLSMQLSGHFSDPNLGQPDMTRVMAVLAADQ